MFTSALRAAAVAALTATLGVGLASGVKRAGVGVDRLTSPCNRRRYPLPWTPIWKWRAGGTAPAGRSRVVIGRSPRSDIVLDADGQVSRTHAVLDRIAGRWILRDAGSRNGTRVNGEPVRGRVRLRAGDEIRIGRSTFLLRAVPPADDPVTERQPPPPTLTARERDVLLAVVRPLVARPPARSGGAARRLITPRARPSPACGTRRRWRCR